MTLSMYTAALFLHILAAMVLVGGSLFTQLLRGPIRSATSIGALRGWLDLGRRSARLNPPSALLLLATGLWLGRDGWWDFPWFWVAVGAWAVNATLAVAVVRRAAVAVAVAAARAGDGPVSSGIDRLRRSRSWALAETVMATNDLALLFLMVDKPALGRSLAVVALAHLAVFGVRLVKGRLQRARAGAAPVLSPSPGRP